VEILSGEYIKRLREEKGISKEEIAEKTKINISIIDEIEKCDNIYDLEPHKQLLAKQILKELGVEVKIKPQIEKVCNISCREDLLEEKSNKLSHILVLLILIALTFIASANINKTQIQTNQVVQQEKPDKVSVSNDTNQEQPEEIIQKITLKADDEVWITADIDGEKSIFNIKKDEEKTIYFKGKISFETIGNADKLRIIFNNQEVRFQNKEVVHNVFVDKEGVFYSGYNLLRGIPKI